MFLALQVENHGRAESRGADRALHAAAKSCMAPLRSPTGPSRAGVDPQGAHFAMVSASK
jgi:hypothetical protein